MAKISSTTFTTNTTTLLCQIIRPRGLMDWKLMVSAFGTWGGGTMTFKISPDNGTTKITLDDGNLTSPTNVSLTANRILDIFPASRATHEVPLLLYATLAGSSGASLTVTVDSTE